MIPTWGTSTGRNSAGGIPSLLLDFSNQSYLLNGTAFAAFDGSPGITFSRGTNATLIDSTGTLTYAPSNLLRNSESLNGTGWSLFGATPPTVTSNAAVAPDGTTTADSIVLPVGSGIFQNVTPATVGVNYSISWWIKADAPVTVRLLSNTDTSVFVSTTCSVTTEWQRFSLVRILPAGATAVTAQIDQGGGATVYAWGAQIGAVTYETAPRAYNSTTPKNLLGFTEEFDNAAWGKTNISAVTANFTVAPNGTTTADKLIPNATNADHSIDAGIGTVQSGNIYTLSVYAKADGYNFIRLSFGGGAGGGYTFFDVLNGNIGGTSGMLNNTIENVGNGWFRCSVKRAAGSTATLFGDLYVQSANNQFGWAGNGTSGVYLWGAQLSDSASLDPYVYNPAAAPTSTAYYGPRFDYDPNYAYSTNNLITRANPQDFSNASFWSKSSATAPATTATADPAETYTAYKLTESATGPSGHIILWQGIGTQVVLGTEYTISGYVKLADAARPSVNVFTNADNGAFTINGGTVNLSTGVVTSPIGSGITVVDAGNGWWRWAITTTATASAGAAVRLYLLNAVGNNTYIGDGTSGVYIWGAQLVTGAAPVPFYYYPYTPLGLLIEEARTNLMFPSDATTGWSASPASSVTATANAAISPDGTINATKLATNDTATSEHLWFKTYTGAINTAYCGSVYLKAGEYTRAQVNFGNTGFASIIYGALFDLAAGAVVATGGGSTATITPVGNGWYRCSVTATSDADGGAYVFTISPKPASVTTISATYTPAATGLGVYVYGVQVEAAGFATSFIPTVSASATRSADVATMVGNNFSNWYNQTTGTLAVTFDASANGSATYVSASNGTITQNSVHIDNQSGNMRAAYRSGSTEVAAIVLGAIGTAGTTNKIATAYAVNDFAASRNGGAIATDTLGAVPVGLTQLNIGTDDRLTASFYTSNHIKTISYFNSRLPNSSLQAITA